MRVLFILPSQRLFQNNLVADLGLGYLATALRKSGHHPMILLPGMKEFEQKPIEDIISQHEIHLIGIKILTSELKRSIPLYQSLHHLFPSIPIVLGGPHVNGVKEFVFQQFPDLSYAFHGESERSFPFFVDQLQNHGHDLDESVLHAIPGLIWKRADSGIHVNSLSFCEKLDELGFAAWDLLHPDKCFVPFNSFYSKGTPIAGIITSRGCSQSCGYCACSLSEGKRVRMRTAKHIVDEIEHLVRCYGVKEIQFLDNDILHHSDHMIQLCQEMIRRKLSISWGCSSGVRISALNKDIAMWMGRAGCHFLFLGIESGSERIQKKIKKNVPLEIVPEVIRILHQNNIRTGGFFIVGFPGETRSEIQRTLSLAERLDLDMIALHIFLPLPGTDIYNDLILEKKIDTGDFFYSNFENNLSEISSQELKKMIARTYIRFLSRPGRLFYLLKNMNSLNKMNYLSQSLWQHIRKMI